MLRQIIRTYIENKHSCDFSDGLDQLKRLTESLPSWEQRWAGNGDRIVDIDVERGKCRAYGLHKEPAFAVALCEQNADTFFACHSHEANEYVLCLEGEVRLEFQDGDKVILYPGMAFCIPDGMNHSAYFPIYTRSLAVTMPADVNFPGGGRFSERIEDEPARE